MGHFTAMTRWRCEICEIDMSWYCHHEHISGEEHAAAVVAAGKDNPSRVSRASTSGSDEKRWTCTICQMEMELQNRESHLSGRRHVSNAAKEEREKVFQDSTAQRPSSQKSSAQKPTTQEDSKRWTCTICKDVMHIQGRDFHLSSSYHNKAAKMATSEAEARDFQAPRAHTDGTIWKCTVCDIEISEGNKKSHLSGKQHKIAAQSLSECNSNSTSSASMTVKLPLASSGADATPEQSQSAILDRVQKLVKGIKVPQEATPQPHHQRAGNSGKKKKKKGSRNHQAPTGPLDSFFLSYGDFPYDSSQPPADSSRSFENYLTRRWYERDSYSPDSPATLKDYRTDHRERYQAALTSEFNLWFGTEENLTGWHSLCRAMCKVKGSVTGIQKCEVEN